MKRNCNGCKALEELHSPYCGLHYKTEIVLDSSGKGRVFLVPIEDCPKPITNKKYCEIMNAANNKDSLLSPSV
jgi:hypothetical protein